ncbi:hypothetical protein D3C76_981450 [compost metagenome]
MTGHAHFHALHALFTRQLGRTVGHGFAGVALLYTEQRCIQLQTLIQQLPFGPQFPGLVFLWRQVFGRGSQATTGGGQAFGGGVERVAPGDVDASVLGRFVNQARAAAELLVGGLEVGGFDMSGGVALSFTFELVIAQPQVQVPLLMQSDGIEHIERLVGQFSLGVAAGGLVDRARPVTGRIAQVVTVAWVQRSAKAMVVGLQVQGFS